MTIEAAQGEGNAKLVDERRGIRLLPHKVNVFIIVHCTHAGFAFEPLKTLSVCSFNSIVF
jgi:hypothetical protein